MPRSSGKILYLRQLYTSARRRSACTSTAPRPSQRYQRRDSRWRRYEKIQPGHRSVRTWPRGAALTVTVVPAPSTEPEERDDEQPERCAGHDERGEPQEQGAVR
jgi:hypothetical protein